MTAFDELIGILAVHGFALALAVGTVRSAHMHPFVEGNAAPLQRIDDKLLSAGYKTGLVGVFDTQYEFSAQLFGQQIIKKRGSYTPGM
jgi:hypothetical protein